MVADRAKETQRQYRRWRTIAVVSLIFTLFFSMNSIVFIDGELHIRSSIDRPVAYHTHLMIYDFTSDDDRDGDADEHRFVYQIPSQKYESYRYDTLTKVRIALGDFDQYGRLLTPEDEIIQAIADDIRSIAGSDDELFADLALQIAHQQYYVETAQSKHPVETLVEGSGDCDCLAVLVASIVAAGGLDVVLLLYEDEESPDTRPEGHMQVGIALPNAPAYARQTLVDKIDDEAKTAVTYGGTTYYVGETTVGEGYTEDWSRGWRLGEVECYNDAPIVKGATI